LRDETPELELRDYLRILRRRKRVVAAVVVVVVGATLAFSYLQTPVYRASARVLLQSSASDTLFNQNTGQPLDVNQVQTEIQVVASQPVQDKVRSQLGSAPAISAVPVGQTDVIDIRSDSTSAARAAQVANAYANAYIDVRRTQQVDDLLAAATQIKAKIADLQKQIDLLNAEAAKAPPDQVASIGSRRDDLVTQQDAFNQKLNETDVESALQSGGAQLVAQATAPGTPIKPRPRRNGAIALVVGLLAGIGLAFLIERHDDSIKSQDDLERAGHGHVATLGLIPAVSGWKNPDEERVVSLLDPRSPTTEAYRALRTSIQFLGLDHPVHVLQITSPSASEGKTTTLANLGVALASTGRRVVLISSDLRRPRIDKFFGLHDDVGLTSVILGEVPLTAALQRVPDVDGLSILASGPSPPNPSELLGSARAAEVIAALRDDFDMVLLDSPPVLPVTDAAVLSAQADATLLVATAGKTRRRDFGRAVELLRQVEAPLVGCVLNGVSTASGYGYGYGYYRYEYAADGGRAASGNGSSHADVGAGATGNGSGHKRVQP
jgi:capsular exopolysaccharide synthesis family protein